MRLSPSHVPRLFVTNPLKILSATSLCQRKMVSSLGLFPPTPTVRAQLLSGIVQHYEGAKGEERLVRVQSAASQ